MGIRNPIFVVGNPRSGTTLLRLVLTSHSKINIPPESNFIIRKMKKYKKPKTKGDKNFNRRNRKK